MISAALDITSYASHLWLSAMAMLFVLAVIAVIYGVSRRMKVKADNDNQAPKPIHIPDDGSALSAMLSIAEEERMRG